MKNSKLLNLLRSLTKTEFREFGLFVNSPYHNKETVLIIFYDILKKLYPDFNDRDVDRKIIYTPLFPGKKYNDGLFRNTVSDLLKLAEKFLTVKHLEKESFYGQYWLLKELTNRKQNSLFKTNFKKADKLLDSDTARDEIYYQNKFLLEDEWRRNHVATSSRMLFEEDNLKKQSESLHVYYITEFTKLYAILLNQSKYTYDYKFNFELFEAVTDYLRNNFSSYSDIPYINIFYNCVMLYKTEEAKYFTELKKLLLKHYKLLTLTDRKNIFIVLINYCNDRISKGDNIFIQEKFTVNEHLLKSKAYFEGNDFMPHYIYESIASTATELGKTGWAEKFLKNYKSIVHSDFKENSFNYCMAEIMFNKNEYDKALEYLSAVKPEDVKARMKINILLMKIYYSGNDTVQFNSLTDSLKKYINRNRTVQEINRKKLSNFLIYICKLYRIKNDGSLLYDIGSLKEKITACFELFEKKWLKEQADLLMIK
ncbi:MAG: hypothetical protein IPM96_12775 [Ignavibacteria bacterium]|nr:hypothetical protein [Ignavibacteria bacterium]